MAPERPKPKLSLDVAKANAKRKSGKAYEIEDESDNYPKRHTKYVDLVTQLRDPKAAEPMEKWMATGRKLGASSGARSPKQKLARPRRRKSEVIEEEHGQALEEDASGSLSGSEVTQPTQPELKESSQEKSTKKEQGVQDTGKAPEEDTSEAVPPSSPQQVIGRYKYPKEIYKKDRSNEEYLAVFEQMKKENE